VTLDKLEALHAALGEAATVFRGSKPLAAMVALEAITKLIEETHPEPLKVLEPIDWMMAEFIQQELPEPGLSQFDAVRLGIAAGAIDLLKAEKLKVPEAAQLVSRQCGLGTKTQLETFRKNVGKDIGNAMAKQARLEFVNSVKPHLREIKSTELRKEAILSAARALAYK